MKYHLARFLFTAILCAIPGLAGPNNNKDAHADQGCYSLPSHEALRTALTQAVAA